MSITEDLFLEGAARVEKWSGNATAADVSWTGRAGLTLGESWFVWGAASQSKASPGYQQSNLEVRFINLSENTGVALMPDRELKPLTVRSAELGLRGKLGRRAAVDLTGYVGNVSGAYDSEQLDEERPSEVDPDFRVIVPVTYRASKDYRVWGAEAVAKLEPLVSTHLELSYTFWHTNMETAPIVRAVNQGKFSPAHVLRVRGRYHAARGTVLSASVIAHVAVEDVAYYNYAFMDATRVDPTENPSPVKVADRHIQLDLKVSHRLADWVEVWAWGRDVLSGHRIAMYDSSDASTYPHTVHRMFGLGLSLLL